jgi:hypothetical protein
MITRLCFGINNRLLLRLETFSLSSSFAIDSINDLEVLVYRLEEAGGHAYANMFGYK